jgi:hypothetical protein
MNHGTVSNLNYIELFDFIGELSKTSIGHYISPLFNLLDSSKKVVDDLYNPGFY